MIDYVTENLHKDRINEVVLYNNMQFISSQSKLLDSFNIGWEQPHVTL